MIRIIIVAMTAVIAALTVACQKDSPQNLASDENIKFEVPVNFGAPHYDVINYPVTKDGFILGRKLFYDGLLSRNGTISCGSCHEQGSAFTHHGHDISHGIDDRLGRRNAPAIQNMAWYVEFMWDGGVNHLDLQPIAPITAHEEMDEDLGNVLEKLRRHKDYPTLFKKAYGNDSITTARFLKAISQFMNMLVSADSKYDKVMRKESGASFSPQEAAGYALFKKHCASCHTEPLFTDQSYRDNGLGVTPNNDMGRYEVTLRPEDKYTFKVPSLRNVMLTAPYMHNGSIRNIDGVLEHYTRDVQTTENLDPLLRHPTTGKARPISLTDTEKEALKAFLHTLSDATFIRNRLFSEPL
jgi:cytochrome c peroxidase